MPLTAEEKTLVRRTFMHGPAALLEAGLPRDALAKFLGREDVQEELDILVREFGQQTILTATAKFGLTRQISRLGEGAVAVLAKALIGPEYSRDADGNILADVRGNPILREPEASPVQLRAADSILDRLGLEGGKGQRDTSVGLNVNVLFKSQDDARVFIQDDPAHKTEEQRALSRERVRSAIEVMSKDIPTARARLVKELGLSKNVKKRAKKKSAKKRKAKS